jgi:hypothetical protein
MDYVKIIGELSRNRQVFSDLLAEVAKEQVLWKSHPEKWCLLEIVCHLYDEEREDFRARLKHVLETPNNPLPSINPVGWVTERKYLQQDYQEKLKGFLEERKNSIAWLQSLSNPPWYNAYMHPKFGAMTAKMFLTNWVAHDYLHFRQITKLKYDYLAQISGETLDYAGAW